jgi:hypothetical protein
VQVRGHRIRTSRLSQRFALAGTAPERGSRGGLPTSGRWTRRPIAIPVRCAGALATPTGPLRSPATTLRGVRALSDEVVLQAVLPHLDMGAAVTLIRSGSLQAGLGTPASDIDVYVLCASVPSDAPSDLQIHIAETRVDVEWLANADVSRGLASLRDEIDACKPLAGQHGPFDQAARIATATFLHGNISTATKLSRVAQETLDAARVRWSSELLGGVINGYEDLLGFIASADRLSTHVLRTRLVLQALDALCVMSRNYYRGDKWIVARSRGAWPATIAKVSFDEEAATEPTAALACVQVLTGVGALGLDACADPALLSAVDRVSASVLDRRPTPTGPMRNPLFFLSYSTDGGGIVVNRADREAYSLDLVDAACFVAASGCDACDVTADAQSLLQAVNVETSAREIHKSLHRLASRRLVDASATWDAVLSDPRMTEYFRQ